MNEQEMQFADPDWQPVPRTSILPPDPEKDVPVPINAGRQAWQSTRSGPESSTPGSSYEQGYQGQMRPPVFSATHQQTPFRQGGTVFHPRARRQPWLWVVAFFVLIWLIPAALFGATVRPHRSFVDNRSAPIAAQPFNYNMTGISALKINTPNVSIHVHSGAPDMNGIFNIQGDSTMKDQLQFIASGDGTLTVQMGIPPDGSPVSLDIILPENIALDLNTGGDIQVDGISGQFSLQSNTSIILNNDSIMGQSTISTEGGNVQIANGAISGTYSITDKNGPIALQQEKMSGQGHIQTNGAGDIQVNSILASGGNYTFTTDSGNIDLFLPSDTAMQLNIDPGNGTISNDFPPGAGGGPQAQVNLKTGSGKIQVHKSQ